MTNLEKIQKKPISPEREKEVIEALTRLSEKSYEEYKKACKEFSSVVVKLFFDFGRLKAKNSELQELHEKLKRKFLDEDFRAKQRADEVILNNVINSNLKKAGQDSKLNWETKEYWIINEKEWDKIGKIIQISIPYTEGNWEDRKYKFAYSVMVHERKTPKLYESLKAKLNVYEF